MKKTCFFLSLLLVLGSQTVRADAPQYRVVQRLAVGGSGGWDYPTVDPTAHLLYLSRADHVAVIDTVSGGHVADIADTPGVHGIALAPELNRGYISCGKANMVKVFDLKTRAVLASVPTGPGPDAIVYDAATQRVFALNGHGHSATVIDARTNAVVATIPLGGKPEFARSDNQGHLLVNIEDTAELVTLDTKAATVTARWPLPHCEEPTGLAFDIAHHRSFSTCGNQVLAVLDTSTGHAIASVPIGKGVDGAEFDSATQTLFSANGEGNITVVREQDPDHYTVLQTLQTQRGARTIALDVTTHRLYSPTAEFGAPVAPSADNPRGRPPVLPGTFVVLVVANPSPSSSVEAAGACSQDREYLVVQ